MSAQHATTHNKVNPAKDHKWSFEKLTVIFPDPRLDESYFEYWIPQDDIDTDELKDSLKKIPGIKEVIFFDDHAKLLTGWRENPPQFVFNQADDGFMNIEEYEPHVTAYMDMLNVRYTGPGCKSIVLTKDKAVVRGAAVSVGVPVPYECYLEVGTDLDHAVPHDLPFPVFCKLANASGSTGVLNECLAHSRADTIKGLKLLRDQHPERPLLIQEFLSGREFSIGMVGNPQCDDFEVFPPVEVDYSALSPQFARVQLEEFKRDGNSQFWQETKEIRAHLTPEQHAQLKDYARRMFIRLCVADFARMDFRMDRHGNIKLMDVNPNCWVGGKYRMMAEWAGYPQWSDILARIFMATERRYALKQQQADEKRERQRKAAELSKKKAAEAAAASGSPATTSPKPQ